MILLLMLVNVEFPFEVHGAGWMGKYFGHNERYNIDASIEIYADLVKLNNLYFSIDYRHDLDMAGEELVIFDPRYVHYYIIPGFNYSLNSFVLTARLIHDCVHIIDFYQPAAPVFNRLRFGIMDRVSHWRNFREEDPDLNWSLEVGFYPQWQVYKWMNWGTDYMRDLSFEASEKVLSQKSIGLRWGLSLHFNQRMWGGFYHDHHLRFTAYKHGKKGDLNLFYDYCLYANDPIKAPNRLGIICLGVQF